jgi:hypothetical protein
MSACFGQRASCRSPFVEFRDPFASERILGAAAIACNYPVPGTILRRKLRPFRLRSLRERLNLLVATDSLTVQ